MGLFAKKQADKNLPALPASAGSGKSGSHFGKNLTISGTISGEDNVDVHGCLDGDIDLGGHLEIGRDAIIEGNVTADTITASGKVNGRVTAGSALHMERSASISGSVTTPKLSVREGAVFNGELKMGTEQQNGGIHEK